MKEIIFHNEHNIVVYLSDLTTLLGKTIVTSLYSHEGKMIFSDSKLEIYVPLCAVRKCRGLTKNAKIENGNVHRHH